MIIFFCSESNWSALITTTTSLVSDFTESTGGHQGNTTNSTTMSPAKVDPQEMRDFYIGLTLAIMSSVFIGASFIIKKKALIKLSAHGLRASKCNKRVFISNLLKSMYLDYISQQNRNQFHI